MIMTVAHSEINSRTRLWLEKIVVGLDLCPFAAPVINEDRLRLEICDSSELEDMLSAVLRELDLLQQNDEHLIATSLLVFRNGLEEFDDFWSLVEIANELLQQVGLEGVIQIASFHPDYCFEGVAVDDASHYTNRSPCYTLYGKSNCRECWRYILIQRRYQRIIFVVCKSLADRKFCNC